ncbi:phospholipid:diacylglycerol acyltransferase [Mycena vulgaris]|nr:phospholipid:diacylglycerol acyltransferase [Mycena vulgaris]
MVLVKRAKTWADPDSATLPEKPDELAETANQLKAEVSNLKKPRRLFASRRFLFPLGILLGALIAFALVEPRDIQDLHAHLTLLLGEYEFAMPDIPGFDLSRVETEWQRLRSNIPEVWKFNTDGREFQVGEAMRDRGLSAQHPVVLIPGIISTGLESWSTDPDYRAFFRQKLWGGFNMLSQVTFNREKWIAAMMLDPVTGLDPPGAKIRAAEGIDAASSFIQGYWIWSKIVENLAVVNYDTNNLHLAPYDWRLSYYNLEERDGYFSKLKTTIEGFKRRQNKKTVIAAHSMGATVVLYFFKWVESPAHGGGGPDWVENHIEAYISIAGTHLGVAKAMSAFLSGEMKDTVQMNPAGSYVLERFFSRAERQKLFRSWAGSASMWIKGGDAIWGSPHGAPDDEHNCTHTHGELIAFRVAPPPPGVASTDAGVEQETLNMTADAAGAWILQHTPSSFQKMMATNFSFGIERDEAVLEANNGDHTKWSNPLEVQLPRAPSMKMYCVYGHGKETERSYWYTQGANEYDETADSAEEGDPLCVDPSSAACVKRTPFDTPLARKSWIDSEYTDEGLRPTVRNGVKMGEGDGTVSLVSLGAMCVEGWKRARWNPAGISVTTVELPHRPIASIPRGGANTSDHVDILGSTGLNEIILKVATGVGDEIADSYVSDIREYARRMHWD